MTLKAFLGMALGLGVFLSTSLVNAQTTRDCSAKSNISLFAKTNPKLQSSKGTQSYKTSVSQKPSKTGGIK